MCITFRSTINDHLFAHHKNDFLNLNNYVISIMLVGSQILEEFIDHMERDDFVRLRWLKRIRESGFDQALSEYRESLICSETLETNICQIHQGQ